MKSRKQRLRVFAGPNGSGKSTVKNHMPDEWIGVYVNADDIEISIRNHQKVNLANYQITAIPSDWESFIVSHGLLRKDDLSRMVGLCTLHNNILSFPTISNSYLAAITADFIRHKLLDSKISFSFETVMSFHDKIDFMEKAKKAGYRVYLYFIATTSPEINIDRVANRVEQGGHSVPVDKIKSRYHRSIGLLPQAIYKRIVRLSSTTRDPYSYLNLLPKSPMRWNWYVIEIFQNGWMKL